jgi:tetratricopeptide (TPR) repeat protein
MTGARPMSFWRIGELRALGFCAAVCSALIGCAASGESPEVFVERGHLMESHGQFQEAIDAYSKALAQRPNDANVYYDRGVAYGRLNQWKEAIGDYTRAIEHDAGMAKAYNNRAAAYAQQHDYQRAIADFTKAISLDPGAALAYRNRALAYHDLGQLTQAIEDYTVAIRLEPNVFEGPFERGNAYLDLGEFQKAVADFDQAIAIDATRATAWLNRGEAYRRMGNTKLADADIAKARELDPSINLAALTQNSVPKESTVTASKQIAQPDSAARRERVLRVAKDFLESKGFHVEATPAPAPFDLVCAKGEQRLRVEVQAPTEGQAKLRFTREQIEATGGNPPATLVVVEKLTSPAAPGLSYTGGTVVQFVENWQPVQQKLVPVVFEYPLH